MVQSSIPPVDREGVQKSSKAVVAITLLFIAAAELFLCALVIKTDKGDMRAESHNPLTGLDTFFVDAHGVLNRRMADFAFFSDKTEDRAAPNAFFELHLIHADRHKVAAGVIQRDRDIADFVNPFQKVAAEEKTVVVEMFG